MKHHIHQVHESSRGIGQSKRHYQELIVPIPCPESCLGYVFTLDFQLVIPRTKVNLREDLCHLQLIKQVIRYLFLTVTRFNSRQSIHNLIVPSFFFTNNTSAPQGDALGLMNPLSRSSYSCSSSSDEPLIKELLQLFIEFLRFSWCHSLWCFRYRRSSREKINGEFNLLIYRYPWQVFRKDVKKLPYNKDIIQLQYLFSSVHHMSQVPLASFS